MRKFNFTGKVLATFSAGVTVAIFPLSAAAQADSLISSELRMHVSSVVTAEISTRIPMTQAEAQIAILQGAVIELRCYGQDTWTDNSLFSVKTYSNSTGSGDNRNVLIATNDGVQLESVVSYPKGKNFNEDSWPDVTDEVYCKARWIAPNGQILTATTNVVKGVF